MKTLCDGIEFRSRTEAAWYLVLKAYGLDPIYEPQTFELRSAIDGERDSCWYMPDFQVMLSERKTFVEIKAGLEGELTDIAKACLLGYQFPTLIIVGWPLSYRAIVIHERCKGNPAGYELRFRSDLQNRLAISYYRDVRLHGSYPDEHWLEIYADDSSDFAPRHTMEYGTSEGDLARWAWNATKWNR